MRLTRLDGSRVEITNPRILGDTIVGTGPRSRRFADGPVVALDDIWLVETHEIHAGNATLVVVGLGIAPVLGSLAPTEPRPYRSWRARLAPYRGRPAGITLRGRRPFCKGLIGATHKLDRPTSPLLAP